MTHLLVGDRVRLAEATTRDPATQGHVIEADPHADRGTVVRVGFENGTSRWVSDYQLVRFGGPNPAEVLAEWEAGAAWHRRHHDVVCYLGHEDCEDEHMVERDSDAADWAEDMVRVGPLDYRCPRCEHCGYMPPCLACGWRPRSVIRGLRAPGEQEAA